MLPRSRFWWSLGFGHETSSLCCMWKTSKTLNKSQRILIAAWWHSLQIWEACYAVGGLCCQALIRALVLLQDASAGQDLPRCNCRGAGLVPKYSCGGRGNGWSLVKGFLWYRRPWSKALPTPLPPISFYGQRQENIWKKRSSPTRAVCRVIFPGDVLLQLCNTWLIFASSHSTTLVSPAALGLIYGNKSNLNLIESNLTLSECPILAGSHLCNFSWILEICSCKHITNITHLGQGGYANVLVGLMVGYSHQRKALTNGE